jgi:small subunit ribosomal protein S16
VAVKIRLKRMGKIRAPYYRIVVADSRTKRDGRVIEEIGKYHPTEEPSFIEVQSERAQYWLGVGAQPSPQVEAILKLTGDWGIFKGDKNAKSTVKVKGAKVEFLPDEKKKPVLKPKSEKPAPKVEEPAAVAEAAPVAEPVEAPVAETPVEADAAADQVRAEEADESTTTTLETPEQVDNSDAPAAAAAEPEATDAEAVVEEAVAESPAASAEAPAAEIADDAPAEA